MTLGNLLSFGVLFFVLMLVCYAAYLEYRKERKDYIITSFWNFIDSGRYKEDKPSLKRILDSIPKERVKSGDYDKYYEYFAIIKCSNHLPESEIKIVSNRIGENITDKKEFLQFITVQQNRISAIDTGASEKEAIDAGLLFFNWDEYLIMKDIYKQIIDNPTISWDDDKLKMFSIRITGKSDKWLRFVNSKKSNSKTYIEYDPLVITACNEIYDLAKEREKECQGYNKNLI